MPQTKAKRIQFDSAVYRLVISYITLGGFQPVFSLGSVRAVGTCPVLDQLKQRVLDVLLLKERPRGLSSYKVAWETHSSNGLAHLDILLHYSKTSKKSLTSFDYLLPLCPQDVTLLPDYRARVNITAYSASKLNEAIIQYGDKEDPRPLTNFTSFMTQRVLTLARIKKDPYGYLEDRLNEDPYNFSISRYAQKYDLARHITGWSAIKTKLRDIQQAKIGRLELQKPGFKYITRQLIQQQLSPAQLLVFDSYAGFQIIVDHLNQIPLYGSKRPHKTKNLYLWGSAGIGKSSLLQTQPSSLDHYVGTYYVKLENKYLNQYQNGCYGFINWNEFKYSDFSPTWVLQFLEGLPVSIPMRYNACIKRDNPLVIMISNISLDQHLCNRFESRPHFLAVARENLSHRITVVHIPVDMTFMQKLFVSPTSC